MTKKTINAPGMPSVGPYSHAVEANGFVFLSGVIPMDPETGDLVLNDIAQATELALQNAKRVLAACGLALSDVVKAAVYLADMNDFASMNEVYARHFDKEPPARTCIAAKQLPKGVPVAIGAGDAPAAAYGAGLLDEPDIFYAAGTTDCLMFTSTRAHPDARFANCAYCTPGRRVSIATMTSSGAAVTWFARQWVGARASAATVEALAANSPAGAGGLVFLPYLQGERTPMWDPQARGLMLGLQLGTRRQDMARAVLEGTALGLRMVVETLESSFGTRARRIVAIGGGTQNRLWMAIKAAALGRSIHVMSYQETSTLGAALLGGIAAGVYRNARQALRATRGLRRTTVIRPNNADIGVYNALYAVYAGQYRKHRQDFRALARLAGADRANIPGRTH